MYLQTFNTDIGKYTILDMDKTTEELAKIGRDSGLPWRILSENRAKPLPDKPIFRKARRKAVQRAFSLDTCIVDHYKALVNTGRDVTIHLWADSGINHLINSIFKNHPNVSLVYLDNNTGEPIQFGG